MFRPERCRGHGGGGCGHRGGSENGHRGGSEGNRGSGVRRQCMGCDKGRCGWWRGRRPIWTSLGARPVVALAELL